MCALSIALLGSTLACAQNPPRPAAQPNRSDILKQLSDATARVVQEVSPSVVGIWVDIRPTAQQTALEQGGDQPPAEQWPRFG